MLYYIGLFLHQKLPFPLHRLPFGGKSALELLLALPLPVSVAELHYQVPLSLFLNAAIITPPLLSVSTLVP